MAKVKICGLTRMEDIIAVNRYKPDYIGFVFVPESRRHITVQKAVELKKKLDPAIQTVGVFVNQTIEWVAELCSVGLIDIAQLHGEEDDDYITALQNMTGKPVIKALPASDETIHAVSAADYLLFDTPAAERGGTGKTFSWTKLETVQSNPYFLAGGLHNGNISTALTLLNPFCVDVSSGVESNGVKDAHKIESFIASVRKFSVNSNVLSQQL